MNTLNYVRQKIRPGDIINLDEAASWRQPFKAISLFGIRHYQKDLFGDGRNWRPTHTVFYFSEDKIFSMTHPRARWEDLAFQVEQKFSVFRFTPHPFEDHHLDMMADTAEQFIGIKYDVGDLLDIMINKLLGYPHVRKFRFFDISRHRKVCSTAIRTLYEKMRKDLEEQGDFGFPRLFNALNPDCWSPKFIKEFERTDVEMTTPAHFGNSYCYSGEFKRVCDWREFEDR